MNFGKKMCDFFSAQTKLLAQLGGFILNDHAMHAKATISNFESHRITSMSIKNNFR